MPYNYIKNSDKEIYDILLRELNREHNTLEFFEYENDKYNARVKHTRNSHRPIDKDEIINLDGWFKKNVKLKKELTTARTDT